MDVMKFLAYFRCSMHIAKKPLSSYMKFFLVFPTVASSGMISL